jgi:proteasome lid subunit RPN8/RPN11
MIVRLTEEQIRFLVEKTRNEYPFEACGLLFGHVGQRVAAVKKIVASSNVLKSSTRFQIDPEEFLGALTKAENENLDHVGFFHSHPASPEPSMTDIKYMQLWPDNIWLMLSSINHEMAAYHAVNSSFRRITLKVNDRKQ